MVTVRAVLSAMKRHPDLAAVSVIGLVALGLRLAFLYRVPVILTGDSQSHYLPGYDLAFGNSFEPELRRPPGYALFAAGTILALGEELRSLIFVQQLLGVGAALLTYLLGRLTFGRTAGLVAGLLVALDGALILSGQSVMTETLFTALFLAALAALLLAARSGGWAWALAAGLLLGAAALTRPVAQALVVLVPLAFLLHTRRLRPVVMGTVLVAIGFGLVMLPWMARNYAEHGTPTAAGGLGRSLIARTIKYDDGYFDAARPAPDDPSASSGQALKAQARQFIRGKRNTIRNSRSVRSTQSGLMQAFNLSQAESDRLMREVAQEAIAERPVYYLTGSLQMAWQIVLGKEKEDTYSDRWELRRDKDWAEQWEERVDHLLTPTSFAEQESADTAEWLTEIFQPTSLGPVLPVLAGLGLLLAVVGARWALVAGLAGLLLLLLSAALDGPVPRYRYPLDPLIVLFAAGALVLAGRYVVAAARRLGPSRATDREPPREPSIGTGSAPVAEASR
jgi:4-amino-4-deoxy-L-arabinose transferase-like glycosyltransferase